MVESKHDSESSREASSKKVSPPILRDRRFLRAVAWTGDQFKLAHSNLYPSNLLYEFEKRFEATVTYLMGMPIMQVAKKHRLRMSLIKRFARDLIHGKPMEVILRNQVKGQDLLLLEFVIAKLRIAYLKTKRRPLSNNRKIKHISSIINRGRWRKFEINSWDDLIIRAFGKKQVKEWEELWQAILQGEKEGDLDVAVSELRELQKRLGRLPKNREVQQWITGAIERGKWKDFGILTWNDLLLFVFKEINIEHTKYIGLPGFTRAVVEIEDFNQKYKRKPTSREFPSILSVIVRKQWLKFGIQKWNDLMRYIFNEINNEPYSKLTLSDIQAKLIAFKTKKGRIPTTKDKEMMTIAWAVRQGYWEGEGILSWNDLVKATFGRTNKIPNKYIGTKGLEKAIKESKQFKSKNKRMSIASDKEMYGIRSAIRRGEWQSFGIKTWNDFLMHVFKKVNKNSKKHNPS